MYWVFLEGTEIEKSEILESVDSVRVSEKTFMPICLARSAAKIQFEDSPLVEIARSPSPGIPKPSTCRPKTSLKSKSLEIAVSIEESVVKEIAGKDLRFNPKAKELINSAARCCASAALPPFPQIRSLPWDSKIDLRFVAKIVMLSAHSLSNAIKVSLNSENRKFTVSFMLAVYSKLSIIGTI
jgi:hypothetical protein